MWRQIETADGKTSQYARFGWPVVSSQIWLSTAPTAVRSLYVHSSQTDYAAVKTLGKNPEVSGEATEGTTNPTEKEGKATEGA